MLLRVVKALAAGIFLSYKLAQRSRMQMPRTQVVSPVRQEKDESVKSADEIVWKKE